MKTTGQLTIELLDGNFEITKLLEEQKIKARLAYELAKSAGTYANADLLLLEMNATQAEDLFISQGWLRKAVRKTSDRLGC